MNKERRAYIELHIAVLLFGFTAILGDLISLSAIVLVWWRVFLASLGFLLFFKIKDKLALLSKKDILAIMGIGCLVGLHWICFFGSIKFANASIALITVSTVAFFTALVEPILLKKKIAKTEIALGFAIVPAMFLIAHDADFSRLMGILVGLLAALLAAIFSSLNKAMVEKTDTVTLSFIELSSACLMIGLIMPFYLAQVDVNFLPGKNDWMYLVLLAFLCTNLAYVLNLRSLKHLTAFASNLVMNLEPIYGIILAIILLKEHKELHTGFYIGGAIILCIIMIYPIIRRKMKSREGQKLSN